jgi:hypothetical protein
LDRDHRLTTLARSIASLRDIGVLLRLRTHLSILQRRQQKERCD